MRWIGLVLPFVAFAAVACGPELRVQSPVITPVNSDFAWSQSAAPVAKDATDQPVSERVHRVIAIGRNLFALNGELNLHKISLDDGRSETLASGSVVGITQSDGSFWSLAWATEPVEGRPIDYLLQSRDRQGVLEWQSPALRLDREEGFPVVAIHPDGEPWLVTPYAVYRIRETQWQRSSLTGATTLRAIDVAAFSRDGGSLFAGNNAGEWGGGLMWIDTATNRRVAVEAIRRKGRDDICAGPLNAACDPVTALVPDHQRPSCVLASIGLQHMSSHGRILRVCGDEVDVLARLYVDDGGMGDEGDAEKFDITEPFFGMAYSDQGVVVVSNRGVYQLDGSVLHKLSEPNFAKVGALSLSFDIPGLLVVMTDANWAMSVSGYTPLLAPIYPE